MLTWTLLYSKKFGKNCWSGGTFT